MRYRRFFLLFLLVTTGMLLYEPARADAQGATLLLRPNPANSAQSVQVFGSGFCPSPCAPVTVRVDNDVAATVRVDARGQFATTITAPILAGSYAVRATQLRDRGSIEAVDSLTVGTTDVNLQGPGPTVGPPPAASPPTAPPPTRARTTIASTRPGSAAPAATTSGADSRRGPPPARRAPTTVGPRGSAAPTSRVDESLVPTTGAAAAPARTTHENSPLPWILLGAGIAAAAALSATAVARRSARARQPR